MRGEKREGQDREESSALPGPRHPITPTKCTRPPWALAWAHSAKNDPHSLSYQMEAALKAFLVSRSTLNYVVSIYPT